MEKNTVRNRRVLVRTLAQWLGRPAPGDDEDRENVLAVFLNMPVRVLFDHLAKLTGEPYEHIISNLEDCMGWIFIGMDSSVAEVLSEAGRLLDHAERVHDLEQVRQAVRIISDMIALPLLARFPDPEDEEEPEPDPDGFLPVRDWEDPFA